MNKIQRLHFTLSEANKRKLDNFMETRQLLFMALHSTKILIQSVKCFLFQRYNYYLSMQSIFNN